MSTRHHCGTIPLPRLSDDAVAEIHLFITYFCEAFEARYGAQITRFYQDLCQDNMIDPDLQPDLDDQPF